MELNRFTKLSLAGAATTVIVGEKTRLLSRQKYACHDITFVTTKLCLLRQKRLSRQIFVATKTCLSYVRSVVCDKCMLVATKRLFAYKSKQNKNKKNLSRQKTGVVATNTCLTQQTVLSRPKLYLCQITPILQNC